MTNNIYKVTLYYYYGDARPEPGVTLFISCDHKPSMEELQNSEIVQWELSRHDCDYIDLPELASEDEIRRCKANIFSLTDKMSDKVMLARDAALKNLDYVIDAEECCDCVKVFGYRGEQLTTICIL